MLSTFNGAVLASSVLFALTLPAEVKAAEEITSNEVREFVAQGLNEKLPDYVQLSYAEAAEGRGESWGLKLDYSTAVDFKTNAVQDGNTWSFGGKGFAFKAKGTYAFSEDNNFDNYSLIEASYKKRWFDITAHSPTLNAEQSAAVQNCVQSNSSDFSVTADVCKDRLGFAKTELSHLFLDADVHVKVEGDQTFGKRNYVYGLGVTAAYSPQKSSFLHMLNVLDYPSRLLRAEGSDTPKLPIFTFGLEQVDGKEDEARMAVFANDKRYDRAYVEISHVSPLGKLNGQPLKLNLSWRYFKELNAPAEIKAANLDRSDYLTVAIQVPSKAFSFLESTDSSLIISFSEGKLPFDLAEQKVFELGWRSNVDFSNLFKP